MIWTVLLLEKPSDEGINCLPFLEEPSVHGMDSAFATEAI